MLIDCLYFIDILHFIIQKIIYLGWELLFLVKNTEGWWVGTLLLHNPFLSPRYMLSLMFLLCLLDLSSMLQKHIFLLSLTHKFPGLNPAGCQPEYGVRNISVLLIDHWGCSQVFWSVSWIGWYFATILNLGMVVGFTLADQLWAMTCATSSRNFESQCSLQCLPFSCFGSHGDTWGDGASVNLHFSRQI